MNEINACLPYLEEQIRLIKPNTMVLMGKVAWKIPRQEDIEYIETYHPAAAMRFTEIRRKFENDFKKVSSKL